METMVTIVVGCVTVMVVVVTVGMVYLGYKFIKDQFQ